MIRNGTRCERNDAESLLPGVLIRMLLQNFSNWRDFTNPWQGMQRWNCNEPICFDLGLHQTAQQGPEVKPVRVDFRSVSHLIAR